MPKFNMVAGISGSGKTTFAYAQANPEDLVLDSDELRKELLGDAESQADNGLIFQTMEARAIEALSQGRDVWYVATNTKRHLRVALLEKLASSRVSCIPVVWEMATPFALCLERNAGRDRHVPEEVIGRQADGFEAIELSEGWAAHYVR